MKKILAAAAFAVAVSATAQTTNCYPTTGGSYTYNTMPTLLPHPAVPAPQPPQIQPYTPPTPGPSLYDRKLEQQRQLGESIGNVMRAGAAAAELRRLQQEQLQLYMLSIEAQHPGFLASTRAELEYVQWRNAAIDAMKHEAKSQKKDQCKLNGKGSTWRLENINVIATGTCGSKDDAYKFKPDAEHNKVLMGAAK